MVAVKHVHASPRCDARRRQPTLPLNRFFGVCLLYPYLLSRFGIIPNGIITTTFNNKLTIYFNAIDNVCDTEHTLSFCVTFKFIIRYDRLDHTFVTDGHYCALLFITYSSTSNALLNIADQTTS